MRQGKLLASLCLVLLLLLPALADAQGNGRGRSRSSALTVEGDATLVVVVNATGADGSFPFLTTGGSGLPSEFTVATTNGTAQLSFGGLRSDHTYSLHESVPAGWSLTGASCDAGTPDAFQIPPDGVVTCAFENLRLARLVVRVQASGGDAAFLFDATGGHGLPASFNVTTTNGSGEKAFHVRPGVNLSLSPLPLAGWNHTGSACSSDAPGSLNFEPGETVTCTFNATRLHGLLVEVRARGGDGTFPFNATGEGLPASFSVDTTNGTGHVGFTGLDAETNHSLVPLTPGGWRLESAWCDSGTPGNVTVPANRTTTCAFTFARLASLSVLVLTQGGDANVTLHASGPGMPDVFHVVTTNGTGQATFAGRTPDAKHTLSFPAATGWRLVSASCSSGAPDNLTLAPGASVTCTLQLTRLAELRGLVFHDRDRDGARDAGEEGLGGLRVHLDADGDGAFDADERNATTDTTGAYVLPDVPPGNHTLRHAPPAGWLVVLPASGLHALALGDALVLTGLDFADATVNATVPPPPPPASPAPSGNPAGPGFWKNWARHGTYTPAQVDAWVRAIAGASAWLMPAGYAEDGSGATKLIQDSTKQCNRTYEQRECARRKLEASLLVLRLNVASGRLAPTATVPVASEAASYLGLGSGATVQQLLDAIEAKAGTQPTRDQYRVMRNAAHSASGES